MGECTSSSSAALETRLEALAGRWRFRNTPESSWRCDREPCSLLGVTCVNEPREDWLSLRDRWESGRRDRVGLACLREEWGGCRDSELDPLHDDMLESGEVPDETSGLRFRWGRWWW